jgi:hypothetical protein
MTQLAGAGSIAYLESGRISSDFLAVTAFVGAGLTDGEHLTTAPRADATTWLWRTEASSHGLAQVALNTSLVAGARPAWFVWVDEPTANPPATNLVAFVDDRIAPGTILSSYQFATSGVTNESQVGAIRWYPGSGLIHQVFVDPDFRRQQLGTILLYAASALHQGRSWPGRLHADGRRTELGQQFAAGIRHPQRLKPHDEVMPPMDA